MAEKLEDNVQMYKAAEEGLRKSEANLNKAQKIARLGSWTYDLRSCWRRW